MCSDKMWHDLLLFDIFWPFSTFSDRFYLIIKSYLSERYNFVHANDESLKYHQVSHGVQQGSVLGPLIFTLQMATLGKITRKHVVHFHCYAYNTRLYLSMKPDETHQLANLQSCLKEIKN